MRLLVLSELAKLRSSGSLAMIVVVGLLAVAASAGLAARELADSPGLPLRGADYEVRLDSESSPLREPRQDATPSLAGPCSAWSD